MTIRSLFLYLIVLIFLTVIFAITTMWIWSGTPFDASIKGGAVLVWVVTIPWVTLAITTIIDSVLKDAGY